MNDLSFLYKTQTYISLIDIVLLHLLVWISNIIMIGIKYTIMEQIWNENKHCRRSEESKK